MKRSTEKRLRRAQRGLGSAPEIHRSRANEYLREGDDLLRRVRSLPALGSCLERTSMALDALKRAVAADVELSAAGEALLGKRIAREAEAVIAMCIVRDAPQASPPPRRLTLIRGGRT